MLVVTEPRRRGSRRPRRAPRRAAPSRSRALGEDDQRALRDIMRRALELAGER
jgi:hypothetical protein